MQFVYPSFLFALAAIIIPIIIHLFHFRRYKKIIFSDLRFLKQIEEQNKAKQKLKDILVLISRILSIIFLVLAFAQPYIPAKDSTEKSGQKAVSVFIDNSFSMNNEGAEGNLLENAKTNARAIVNAYGADDLFQILTHDFEGKQQRLVNKTEAINRIDEVMVSSSSAALSSILKKQKQALENVGSSSKSQYIISDFQAKMCDLNSIETDSLTRLNLIPVEANQQANISVDSVWFQSPIVQIGLPVILNVRVTNYKKEPAENIGITLTINGQQKGLQNITIDEQTFADIQFTFTPTGGKLQKGEVAINDFPIAFDNSLYFSFSPIENYNILSINGTNSNQYITKLFASDATYKLTESTQNQLNFSLFDSYHLIILNEPQTLSSGLVQELKKYIEQGGQLFIIPPTEKEALPSLNVLLAELQLPNYGISLKQKVAVNQLNLQDAIFSNVFKKLPQNMDLPAVNEFYALQRNTNTNGKAIMQLNNGQPFAWQAAVKKGNIVMLASPLNKEWSNFPLHAIYVPFMLKLGTGNASFEKLYYTIGTASWIPLQYKTSIDKLIRLKGSETELALQTSIRQGKSSVYLDQPVTKAGIFDVFNQDNKEVQQYIALNYNRMESNPETMDMSDISKFSSKIFNAKLFDNNAAIIQNTISNSLNGTPFWRYCIWLALIFIAIEILLLRLLK